MRVVAHGKINLCLEVGPRRSDGFHELVTIFQTIALADELIFEESDSLSLEVSGEAPAGPENLVLRSARLLEKAVGRALGARISLRKRIPVGGGLGGGSSDAAATLHGLDRFLRLATPAATLHEIACQLGSDVPYFLLGGTVLGRGRGERLFPLAELKPTAVVLINDGLAVSTASAFAGFAATRAGPAEPQPSAVSGQGESWRYREELFRNDLEDYVFSRYPKLRDYKRCLLELGADHALMSGSGATVYGTFATVARAEEVAQQLIGRGIPAVVTSTSGPRR